MFYKDVIHHTTYDFLHAFQRHKECCIYELKQKNESNI